MEVFLPLVEKLIPLYILIALGYICGKKLDVQGKNLASVAFYVVVPFVVFGGVAHTVITPSVLLFPVIVFIISTILCLTTYKLSGFLWDDSTRNIVSFSSGSGNTGYFGLPVALALFGTQGAGVYIVGFLGIVLYENTVGFFITAKGNHTWQECVAKIYKLPSLYAFIIGLIVSIGQIPIPDAIEDTIGYMRGAYTVMGMMIIGLGLSVVESFKIEWKFIGTMFGVKFIIWPLVALGVIWLDRTWLHLLSEQIYPPLILMSIVPIAANTVVLATLLNVQPSKAATAVLFSTLFAAVYVPVMAMLFLK